MKTPGKSSGSHPWSSKNVVYSPFSPLYGRAIIADLVREIASKASTDQLLVKICRAPRKLSLRETRKIPFLGRESREKVRWSRRLSLEHDNSHQASKTKCMVRLTSLFELRGHCRNQQVSVVMHLSHIFIWSSYVRSATP